MPKTTRSAATGRTSKSSDRGSGKPPKAADGAAVKPKAVERKAGPSKPVSAKPDAGKSSAVKPSAAKSSPAKASPAKAAPAKAGAVKAGAGKASPTKPVSKSPAKAATTSATTGGKPAVKATAPPASAEKGVKVGAPGGVKPTAPAKGAKPTPAVAKPEAIVPKPEATKPATAATPAPATANDDGKKPAAKGITIVTPKPVKKPKAKVLEMPIQPLLKPGLKWKPLIPSGPKAPRSTGIPGVGAPLEYKVDPKARLTKKELDRYREILLEKRSELVGDIANIEDEALRASSGSLSTLPQHMAEQGSDAFDQAISLDLAQVDRHLLREIDAALKRIEEGTYGICDRTGKRIAPERLAELPWARYSIEAAREMERRPSQDREEQSDEDPL